MALSCHVKVLTRWMDPLPCRKTNRGSGRLKFSLAEAEMIAGLCTVCNATKFMSSSSEPPKEHKEKIRVDFRQLLVAGEGLCLSAAVASHAVSLISQQKQQLRAQVSWYFFTKYFLSKTVAATPIQGMASVFTPQTWQLIPLWLALLINILLRALQPSQQGNAIDHMNASFTHRVEKMERELSSSVGMLHALTKQVEKLAVRMQVTRRTLQDPIRQMSKVAESTSEAMKAIGLRENLLEKDVERLRLALFAMQEQQAKQLELIGRLVVNTKKLQDRLVRHGPKQLQQHLPRKQSDVDVKDDYKYDFWLQEKPPCHVVKT